jgi:hypothetical protein
MGKSEDYLNNLVQVYNKLAAADKNLFLRIFNVYRLEGEVSC